jgi:hypothetical protein
MSVYVGIDVHRKRSQVAVIDSGGEVLANRNVPNGTETILGVIGGLPPGTPAASGAAFGWGWLLELLEDYGFTPHLVHALQCKAIASARLNNDKGRRSDPGAAAAGGSAAGGVDRAARGAAAAGAAAAPGAAGCGRCCRTGSAPSWPATGMTGRPGAGAAPARSSSPGALTAAQAPGAPAGPGPRGSTKRRHLRGKPEEQPTQPDDHQPVTGPIHHAILTNKTPMGAVIPGSCDLARSRPYATVCGQWWPDAGRCAQYVPKLALAQGLADAAAGELVLADDALGVDPQENVDTVPGPFGDLGWEDAAVQCSCRHMKAMTRSAAWSRMGSWARAFGCHGGRQSKMVTELPRMAASTRT